MKPPGRRFSEWKTWRQYHRVVWGRIWSLTWWNMIIVAIYSALYTMVDGPVIQLVYYLCGMFLAAQIGTRIGVAYLEMDLVLQRQVAWRQVQQDIRARMIEDGVPPEEADTALWQMDMELEQRRHGGPPSP